MRRIGGQDALFLVDIVCCLRGGDVVWKGMGIRTDALDQEVASATREVRLLGRCFLIPRYQ